jgi:5-methylcytosine-specific restriction endonuclease McrA
MRNRVIKRDGGLCRGCSEAPATQVHHLTYEHIGNEFDWELVAICRRCHQRYHDTPE